SACSNLLIASGELRGEPLRPGAAPPPRPASASAPGAVSGSRTNPLRRVGRESPCFVLGGATAPAPAAQQSTDPHKRQHTTHRALHSLFGAASARLTTTTGPLHQCFRRRASCRPG